MPIEYATAQAKDDAERKDKMVRALKIACAAAEESKVIQMLLDSAPAAIAVLASKIYEEL